MTEYPFPLPPTFRQLFQACLPAIVLSGFVLWMIWRDARSKMPSDGRSILWGIGFVAAATTFPNVGMSSRMSLAEASALAAGLFVAQVVIALGLAISISRMIRQETKHKIRNAIVGVIFLVIVIGWGFQPGLGYGHAVGDMWRTCRNNLKTIALATHEYHNTSQSFPDSPLIAQHSWRINLLPFLDQKPLYQRYHLEEKWDSRKNTALQPERPAMFVCPMVRREERQPDSQIISSYVVLTGPGSMYDRANPALTFSAFADGSSCTLLVVESCGLRRIWTDPQDADISELPMGINLPGRQPGTTGGAISSFHREGAHVAMADGSVRFLAAKTDPHLLKALATPNGDEAVDGF